MLKSRKSKHIAVVLLCLFFVIGYYYFIRAAATPQLQFTADTNVNLAGIGVGDLQVGSGSESAGVDISGSSLTVDDITDGSTFVLKTPGHGSALNLTPSGGAVDLSLNSGNITSNNITEWTLTTAGESVDYVVGVSQANTWYQINVNNVSYGVYSSGDSGSVSFTYSGARGSKVFTIEETAPPSSGNILLSLLTPTKTTPSEPTDTIAEELSDKEPEDKDIDEPVTDHVDDGIIEDVDVVDPEISLPDKDKKPEAQIKTDIKKEKEFIYYESELYEGFSGSIYSELADEVADRITTKSKNAAKFIIGLPKNIYALIGDIVNGAKRKIVNLKNFYKDLPDSIYGEIAEKTVVAVKFVKTAIIHTFDIALNKINNLLPNFIERGYERMFKWVRLELLVFAENLLT